MNLGAKAFAFFRLQGLFGSTPPRPSRSNHRSPSRPRRFVGPRCGVCAKVEDTKDNSVGSILCLARSHTIPPAVVFSRVKNMVIEKRVGSHMGLLLLRGINLNIRPIISEEELFF